MTATVGQWVQIDSCEDANRHQGLTGIIYSDRGDGRAWIVLERSSEWVQTCITGDFHPISPPAHDVVHIAALIAYVRDYQFQVTRQ